MKFLPEYLAVSELIAIFAAGMLNTLKHRIMSTTGFIFRSLCHTINLIDRDDGKKKNETLEKEAWFPCV